MSRVLLPLVLVLACGTPPPAPTPAKATSAADLGQSHPLWSRIWDARAARFIDEKTLASRLVRHRYVLLGERHDNPNHHWLQARVLRALVRAGRRPAVAWEMITDVQRAPLKTYVGVRNPSADGLGRALRWEQSGWPAWRHYRPVAEVALAKRLLLAPAGIDRPALRRMLRVGAGSRPSKPAATLPTAAVEALRRTIRESHCGHASGRMLEMMVQAQQLRDAHMARRLEEAARDGDGDGAVLIAGNGHVRLDRGVPLHMKGDAVSVGILEVAHGQHDAASYARGAGGIAFDYVWFTTRVDNVDPCERFRQQLERMRRHKR